MSEKKTDREILIEAAAIVTRRGLCKGTFVDAVTGACCTLGAIRLAMTGEDDVWLESGGFEQYDRLSCSVSHVVGSINADEINIASWNDKPERTVGDVVAVLCKAAESGDEV